MDVQAVERRPPAAGRARVSPGAPPPARGGRDVYVYFDNDVEVHAPFDAIRLRERLEGA